MVHSRLWSVLMVMSHRKMALELWDTFSQSTEVIDVGCGILHQGTKKTWWNTGVFDSTEFIRVCEVRR